MTVATVLPLFFPCTRTDCVIEQVRCIWARYGAELTQVSGAACHSSLTGFLNVQGSSGPVCRAGLAETVLRITESNLERYTCPERLFNSTDEAARPGLVQGLYNELATLMDVPGDPLQYVIRRLVSFCCPVYSGTS